VTEIDGRAVKTPPRVGAQPSMRSSPKIACSTNPGASTVAATRSIASRARSGQLTLTFGISQLPSPRNWAMAGGSSGYRVALVRHPLTPGLISSLPGTAGLPPFICFSTSYPELPLILAVSFKLAKRSSWPVRMTFITPSSPNGFEPIGSFDLAGVGSFQLSGSVAQVEAGREAERCSGQGSAISFVRSGWCRA
jgi:hypothetical protein